MHIDILSWIPGLVAFICFASHACLPGGGSLISCSLMILAGFGGSLVSFSGAQGAQGQPTRYTVKRQQTVSCMDSISRSERFEQTVSSGDKTLLREFCSSNKESVEGPDDKETWSFLGVLFEEDARRQLQAHLGFSTEPVMPFLASCFSAQPRSSTIRSVLQVPIDSAPSWTRLLLVSQAVPDEPASGGAENISAPVAPDALPDGEGEGDFFDQLADTPPMSPKEPGAAMPALAAEPAAVLDGHTTSEAGEEDVLSALYTGDYAAAVAACIKVICSPMLCCCSSRCADTAGPMSTPSFGS